MTVVLESYESVGQCLGILLQVDIVAVVPSGLVHPKSGEQGEEEAGRRTCNGVQNTTSWGSKNMF